MGSFSWLRATKTTKRKNIVEGDKYKILIPKEFGGGFIIDTYFGYGYVFEYDDTKNHFDSTWDMLKINPKIFRYANKKLRDDYSLAYEAVSQDYYNFRYVSDRLKDDITLARIAYKHDIGMIEYASERIRENPILLKL